MTDATGLAGTDALFSGVVGAVAQRMTAMQLSGAELRERGHLDPFTKNEFERRCGPRPRSQTLRTPDFVGVGPVDVVLSDPRALIELKWSYAMPPKIYESVWDAIKLVLLGQRHDYNALYIATGASREAWASSESADLFDEGQIDPAALWDRELVPPRAFNYGETVGQDCVIGAAGKQPLHAPSRIVVRSVLRTPVADNHELRVIGLTAVGPLLDWPATELGNQAQAAPEPAVTVGLPSRVTQRWIEQTVPKLHASVQDAYVQALQARGWTDAELDERVRPHLPTLDHSRPAGDGHSSHE